jgi:NAD(P)-dependent dehydrogenase (short-subunit alcohol dehydrogenase family)
MSGLAIVTGASRGIGKDVAVRLAAAGYTVACIARSGAELRALADGNPRLLPVAVDVADGPALDRAVDSLLAEHGPCAILVNNAGYGLRGAIEDIDLDAWKRQFEVNLFACARLIQHVLPGMRAARSGAIVNVSSVAGRVVSPFSGAYCATKFALEAMSDALRMELAPFGIRVILVEPGPVTTAFQGVAETGSEALGRANSPYAAAYGTLPSNVRDLHRYAWTSDAVAEKLVSAALSASPPLRVATYSLPLRMTIWLNAVWPALLDRLARRRMGVDRLI